MALFALYPSTPVLILHKYLSVYNLKRKKDHSSISLYNYDELYLPLHLYCKLDQMTFSCEKLNTPNLPPLSVLSKTLPESDTILSPSNIFRRIKPILGLWTNFHLYDRNDFHPSFRGSSHSSTTWFLIVPVCHKEFLNISPGPVAELTSFICTLGMARALNGVDSQ